MKSTCILIWSCQFYHLLEGYDIIFEIPKQVVWIYLTHLIVKYVFFSSGKHTPPSYKMSWKLVLKFLGKVLQLETSDFKIKQVKEEKTMWMLNIIFLRPSERRSVFISHASILINTSNQRRMQQICLGNSFGKLQTCFLYLPPPHYDSW